MDTTYDMFQQTMGAPSWMDQFAQPSRAGKWLDAYGQQPSGSWAEYYDRYRQLFGGRQPEGYQGGGYGETWAPREIDLNDPKYAYLNNALGREADARSQQWQEALDARGREWQEWMDRYSQQQADRDKQFLDFMREREEAAARAQQAAAAAASAAQRHAAAPSGSSGGHAPAPAPAPQMTELDRIYQQVLGRNADPTAYQYFAGAAPAEVHRALAGSSEAAHVARHGSSQGFHWNPTPPPTWSGPGGEWGYSR